MSSDPRTHLSPAQERRLVEYLEEQFLELTRAFKKRSQATATLPTLSSYLVASHTLLSLILQIPPYGPSASLRTILLLRLTGDVLSSVPGYVPDLEALSELLSWLDDLDKGWLAVLRAQAWDSSLREGVDLASAPLEPPTPMSQTERTRLRSLIISGTDKLEEWIEALDVNEEPFDVALERMGVQQSFDDLFRRTLAEMGSTSSEAGVPASG